MKLGFVWVGKTKSSPVRELIDCYFERAGRWARIEVSEVRDRDAEKEGDDIISRIGRGDFVVVLDERGREIDSREFAGLIEKHRAAGTRRMTFVIGSHSGVSDKVRKRADMFLSLSRMTMTHEFARALLAEQVYRAFTILDDLPYHK
jgi:23S rRNA (pseudouridine1915-N3)-methyltransferase